MNKAGNKQTKKLEFDYSELRSILARKNISLHELSKVLGVSYGVVTRWVNEKQSIPELRKLQMQTVLQVPDQDYKRIFYTIKRK